MLFVCFTLLNRACIAGMTHSTKMLVNSTRFISDFSPYIRALILLLISFHFLDFFYHFLLFAQGWRLDYTILDTEFAATDLEGAGVMRPKPTEDDNLSDHIPVCILPSPLLSPTQHTSNVGTTYRSTLNFLTECRY